MKARLTPEAEQDADEAIMWYDEKSTAWASLVGIIARLVCSEVLINFPSNVWPYDFDIQMRL